MGEKIKKALFGICTATTAVHIMNQAVFKMAVRKQILSYYRGHYFENKYGRMFYTVKGEGKPLLLIHDLDCISSGYEWSQMVSSLEKNYRVYVIDWIGCGRSDKPAISYSSYYYVQLLGEFIREVIKEKTNVAATGKSGSIVTMAKMFYPELLHKVMVISPEDIVTDLSYSSSNKKSWKKLMIEIPIFGTLFYHIFMSRNLIEEKFEEVYFADSKNVRNKMINAYYESAHLSGASSKYLFSSLLGHYLSTDLRKALKLMDQNYIIVTGNKNKQCKKNFEQYSFINSSIQKFVINSSAYLPQLEQPDVLYKKMVRFFM